MWPILKMQLKLATELNRKDLRIASQIASIPTKERAPDILRQQEIKESLYLYLLKKHEETDISLAVTEPNAKIV